MAEENKIRDAAEAVKGLVQAVPVYQDALQPAVRELGGGLQTLAKTIHIALAPVSALVWGYDQIKEFVSKRVAEKLKNIRQNEFKHQNLMWWAPHLKLYGTRVIRKICESSMPTYWPQLSIQLRLGKFIQHSLI
jgi:hypothetical protein